MAVSSETRAFVLEVFREVPGVSLRPMMGGLCIYSDGRVFAILGPEDRLYLKAKGALAVALASEGSVQFAYDKAGRLARMGYWTLPETALDDPEEAAAWAERALGGA